MRKKIMVLALVFGAFGFAASGWASTCTKGGQSADPCCCRQSDQGLVCTRTGEALAECCCK